MLGLVVDTGKEFHHVLVGIVEVVFVCTGIPELVDDISRPVAAGLIVGGSGRCLPAGTGVEAHGGHAVFRLARLGGDEDYTVGCAGAVDCGGRCVLDNGDVVDVVGVDHVDVADRTVDEYQRRAAVDRCLAADVERSRFTGDTRRSGYVKTCDSTLKHVGNRTAGAVFEFGAVDRCHGTGKVYFLLSTVADDNGLFKHCGTFLKDNFYLALVGCHADSLLGVADISELESHRAIGDGNDEIAVDVGRDAGLALSGRHRDTDQRLVGGIHDVAFHLACKRCRGRRQ